MAKRSKKEKAAGQEKHRQLKRAKKLQMKQKKNIALPQKHRKNRSNFFVGVYLAFTVIFGADQLRVCSDAYMKISI